MELLKWTSWSNTKSFWIQKELLLQLMNDVGFDVVFEQFDVARNIAKAYTHGFRKTYDRVLLVGVRTA